MKATLIGSFRRNENKNFDVIQHIREIFENNDIEVLSPKKSKIVDSYNKFVILQSDNFMSHPKEIQQEVNHKIDVSDFIYICNPDGYLGTTTAYEVGRAEKGGIPIFALERFVEEVFFEPTIATPEQLIKFCKQGKFPARKKEYVQKESGVYVPEYLADK